MFRGFFGNKVTVKKDAVIGDIVVNLPDFSDPSLPPVYWPLRGLKKIILAVPVPITCFELKKRIYGKTKIPMSSQILFFMGAVVKSDEELALEMYEQELTDDSDDDIFRPRLFLGIVDDPQEEAKVEIYSSESESSSESSIGELDYAIEQREEEERKLEETLLNASENDNEGIQRAFDLKKNLDNIDCSRFYEPLIQEGFIDEGSFANLTDDILKSPPLCIPLVSRQRITALADVTKRRLESEKQEVAETETGKIDKEMVNAGKLKTKAIEGLQGTFTKKIDMKRAWEQKLKDDIEAEKEAVAAAERERLEMEELRKASEEKPRKQLPDHVWDLIDSTRKKCERDEYECLLDPETITTSTFCCLNHYDECMAQRNELEEMTRLLLEADIQVAADRVDYHDTTFVCRYQLRHIMHQFFKKHNIPLETSVGEALLDKCVMNQSDQIRLSEWASPEKRANPLFDMPQSGYSTKRFAKVISDEITEYQQKKILVKDE